MREPLIKEVGAWLEMGALFNRPGMLYTAVATVVEIERLQLQCRMAGATKEQIDEYAERVKGAGALRAWEEARERMLRGLSM